MKIEVVRTKIYRVNVTDAELDYLGSITIDADLMDAAKMIVGEKVQIVNIQNGARFETYTIPGKRGSGEITPNGTAARLVQKDDIIIIIGYGLMSIEEAKSFHHTIIIHNE